MNGNKNEFYVVNELNKINLRYDSTIDNGPLYHLDEDTLIISPTANEYEAVLDHLGVDPQDIQDPGELEKIVMGRMNVDIL